MNMIQNIVIILMVDCDVIIINIDNEALQFYYINIVNLSLIIKLFFFNLKWVITIKSKKNRPKILLIKVLITLALSLNQQLIFYMKNMGEV